MIKNKMMAVMLLFSVLLFAAVGCQKQEEGATSADTEKKQKVELVYVEWSTEVASTNVVRAVLQEKLGYEVELTPVSAAAMWQSIASGDADGMVAAWLPTTHGHYLEKMKDQVVDLGPNLDGTKIGLVVPSYVTIDSIEELDANAEKFNGKIIGIDPGAGLMSKTEKVIEEYGIENLELIGGSGATMTAALANAIKRDEWVVVTGWTPHWKFAQWDLKYLEDPKNVYGGAEQIHTIVRKGLKEDMPEVYRLLDNFEWTPENMQQVMVWNREEGAKPYENAKRWINENPEKVQSWLQ
ncbi:MAG: glycine betaine ABC transporter substrate-binding protein [Geoalkalibacter sp.]|uniref:glycine betaine ABC transporter substrate-binding protein n=1 Tax=Geoalkalibacter sp. TaxID=3041440 RepID=UPI003D125433